MTGKIKLTSSAWSKVFSSSSMRSCTCYDPYTSSFVSKILPVFFSSFFTDFIWVLYILLYFALYLFFNPYRSNVELHSTTHSIHQVQCRAEINALFYHILFHFLQLPPSSGCSLNPEDYKFSGKLIWTRLLKLTKIICGVQRVNVFRLECVYLATCSLSVR